MNKTGLWSWTLAIAIPSGVATLYASVKNGAVNLLKNRGAFNVAIADADRKLTLLDEARPEKHQANEMLVEKDFNARKDGIIKEAGAHRFSGAWKMLSGGERSKSVAFAVVVSVAAGAITQAIIKSAGKNAEGSSNDPGFWYTDFGGGHHHDGCSWHDFGGGGGSYHF